MRERYCRSCGKWHNIEQWPRECYEVRSEARSALPVPMLIRDFHEPVQSMADGKYYNSKSSLRNSYKAENNPSGTNFIEVGNEDISKFTPPPKLDRKANREAVERAICAVESGNAAPVMDKLPTF